MRSAARLVAVGQSVLSASIVAALVAGCGGGSGNQSTYRIPSGAMEPTLKIGQRIHVDTLAYRNANPKLGDIVVFHPPAGAQQDDGVCGDSSGGFGHTQACALPTPQESDTAFVKRVVAGPGDHIAIVNGYMIRDGVRQNEPYVEPCAGGDVCNFPKPIVVPPGNYFMLGDNRGQSDDSRFWGPVPKAWIIGKVIGH